MLHEALEVLEDGPIYKLADLPNNTAPPVGPPGVYTLWDGDDFLYCGMVYMDAAHTTNPQARGVWGRLDTHRRFKRTSNLGVQLMDRVIIPALTTTDLRALRDGSLDLQHRLREWGTERVTYRAWISPDGAMARRVEVVVRHEGLPRAGRPQLNPA
jgi:hypothetical protein